MEAVIIYNIKRMFSVVSIHSAFMDIRDKDFYFGGEAHDFWEVVYVDSGQTTVAEDERVYELKKGDIIFHRPMEFHKIWSKGVENPRVFTMSFKTSGDDSFSVSDGVIHLNSSEAAAFLDIFSQAYMLINAKETPKASIDQKFSCDLERFIIYLDSHRKADTTISKSTDAIRYSTIINVMQQHINEDLSVDDIARLSYMAPSTMKNAFSKFSVCGVRKHFIRMKIVAALPLIKKGVPIGEVSELFSFSCQNYFTKVFKDETGISPTEYKKQF